MTRLCLYCGAENAVDDVLCCECRMSLARAPTGDEALDLKGRTERETESPMRESVDSAGRSAKRMRYVKWALALAAMVCLTLLVWEAGYVFALLVMFSMGSAYEALAASIILATPYVALAPWVLAGIVLGLVRRYRSRASEGPEDTKH